MKKIILFTFLFVSMLVQSQIYEQSFNTLSKAYYNPATGEYDFKEKPIKNLYKVQINESKGLIVVIGGDDPVIITDVSRTDKIVVSDKSLKYIGFMGYSNGVEIGVVIFSNQVELHFREGIALLLYNVTEKIQKT